MIIDTIENIGKYEASFPRLRLVAELLRSGKPQTAEKGSYETDDGSVRYSVSEYQTHAKGTKGYETHKYAADVQIIVSGEEMIDLCENADMKERSGYDAENDIQFFDGTLAARYIARPGKFIVIFPGEGHEPNLSIEAPETVRKVVFKIKHI